VSKLKNLRLDKRDAFDCANNDIIMGESQDLVQAYIKHHRGKKL
jgi:hypothetical protein